MVDQRPPLVGAVGQGHSDLGIHDSSRGAGVLPLDACRAADLLQEPRLVHEPYPVAVKVLQDVGADLVTHLVGVSAAGPQPVGLC